MSTPRSTTVYDPTLPINSLEQFLRETESLFDNIVGPWASLLFRLDDRQLLFDAWAEVKQNLIPKVRAQLSEYPNQIEDAGLAPGSAQLALKFQGLNEAWNAFFRFGSVRLEAISKLGIPGLNWGYEPT
jgi:hypothetical protein